jgi:hypothetical protein
VCVRVTSRRPSHRGARLHTAAARVAVLQPRPSR